MNEKLNERIKYAIKLKHDIIMEKDGNYCSGNWNEYEHAKKCGWTLVGSVTNIIETLKEKQKGE